MSKLTAAYLAGLIDGEGSLEIQRIKGDQYKNGISYQARIRICMTNKEIIKWLYESFGGYFCERVIEDKNFKNSYEWTLRNNRLVKPFINKTYPYLRVKKKHAEIIKRFLKTFNKNSYNRTETKLGYGTGYHLEVKQEIIERREKLFHQIRELNKRGKSVQPERLNRTTSLEEVIV